MSTDENDVVVEEDEAFGASEEEIVKHWCGRSAIAYLGRADIGHDVENKIVVFGARGVSA